jgi:hypothetical protein
MGYREYSPLFFGLALTMFIYLLLVFAAITNAGIPEWLWYYGLLYFATGIVLEFVTRRVFWIRTYQLIGAASIALLASLLLWLLLAAGQSLGHRLFTGVMLVLLVIGSIVASRYQSVRQTGDLSYGLTGRLEVKTGWIDPGQAPVLRQQAVEQARQTESFWLRLTPLFAGLGMFLANTLSERGIELLIILLVALELLVGAMGIGRMFHYLQSIHRLEQNHGKTLQVKH